MSSDCHILLACFCALFYDACHNIPPNFSARWHFQSTFTTIFSIWDIKTAKTIEMFFSLISQIKRSRKLFRFAKLVFGSEISVTSRELNTKFRRLEHQSSFLADVSGDIASITSWGFYLKSCCFWRKKETKSSQVNAQLHSSKVGARRFDGEFVLRI